MGSKNMASNSTGTGNNTSSLPSSERNSNPNSVGNNPNLNSLLNRTTTDRHHRHAPPLASMREYCLRWNNHQPNLVTSFTNLLSKETFVDVTLVTSEGKKILAHKLVLSACSPYFQEVFEDHPCKHPIVILKDVPYADLKTIISFIYNGEVNIAQDRMNSILATAGTLQVKGLAEVPADELKRVGGNSKGSDNSNTRHHPPLLQSSSPWTSGESDNLPSATTEVPRKRLKKGHLVGGGSNAHSTNGELSTSGSFESGVGASVSRSLDDGTSAVQGQETISKSPSVTRSGPPPLTAAGTHSQQPKSHSLDTGLDKERRESAVANVDSELSSGGFSENQNFDDSSTGGERGYDLEVADVKMEDVDNDEGELEFDEDDSYGPDDNPEYGDPPYLNMPASSSASYFQQPGLHFGARGASWKNSSYSTVTGKNQQATSTYSVRQGNGRKRQRASSVPYLDSKFQEAVDLVASGQVTILRASKLCGIPKSTLYLRLKEMGITSSPGTSLVPTKIQFWSASPSRTGSVKGRRGRLLIRQPRIKRLDAGEPGREMSGGETEYVSSGGSNEHESEEEAAATLAAAAYKEKRFGIPRRDSEIIEERQSTHRQQSIVPILMVSGSSPTPPSSPPQLSIDESERCSSPGAPPLRPPGGSFDSSSTSSTSKLLNIPSPAPSERTINESGSILVPAGPSSSTHILVKQVSQPLLPSHTGVLSLATPSIQRQHSTPAPTQHSTRITHASTLTPLGKSPTFTYFLPHSQSGEESFSGESTYLVDTSTGIIQILSPVPELHGSTGSGVYTRIPHTGNKEMEIFKSETEVKVGLSESMSSVDDPMGESSNFSVSMEEESLASLMEQPPVQRSGHCPVLRPGPALGCNYCWNSVDKCGRILRRKTKYHCPECHINLCIVPCFQEYHERADKKKPKGKTLLPKPSSM